MSAVFDAPNKHNIVSIMCTKLRNYQISTGSDYSQIKCIYHSFSLPCEVKYNGNGRVSIFNALLSCRTCKELTRCLEGQADERLRLVRWALGARVDEHGHPVCLAAIRDPHLAPIDHQVISLSNSCCLDAYVTAHGQGKKGTARIPSHHTQLCCKCFVHYHAKCT